MKCTLCKCHAEWQPRNINEATREALLTRKPEKWIPVCVRHADALDTYRGRTPIRVLKKGKPE